MSRRLFFFVLLAPLTALAQEIPLESCNQLPMVKAQVGKRQFQFLLDTGAAGTLLNQKSFPSQETTEIMMESWSGRAGAQARTVV